MKTYYLNTLVGVSLALLVSCQQLTSSQLFNLHPLHHSDTEIRDSVNTALIHNDELATAPIRVEAHQGVVILSGYVKTIRQSDTANDLASKVTGVKSVENNLIVRK